MSLSFDGEKVWANARDVETEDLLDRVTAYRAGLESAAVAILEDELYRRGVTRREIDAHAEACRRECLFHPDGTALSCSYCRRPAVAQGWGWQRLFRLLPALPRRVR